MEDHNIPPHEVRFIQEAKNDKQRKELIKGMNEGKIRVLFGSTSMLGTGVNAQKEPLPYTIWIHRGDRATLPKGTGGLSEKAMKLQSILRTTKYK